jgi:hypothetical protein
MRKNIGTNIYTRISCIIKNKMFQLVPKCVTNKEGGESMQGIALPPT